MCGVHRKSHQLEGREREDKEEKKDESEIKENDTFGENQD